MQCSYHSEFKGTMGRTIISQCQCKAIALDFKKQPMCAMHRNHYDKKAKRLGWPLSQEIEEHEHT